MPKPWGGGVLADPVTTTPTSPHRVESRSATRWVALCNPDHEEIVWGFVGLAFAGGRGGGSSEVRVEWWSKTLVDSLLRSEAPVVVGMVEEAPKQYPLKRETTAMEEEPGHGRKGHSTALQQGRRRRSSTVVVNEVKTGWC